MDADNELADDQEIATERRIGGPLHCRNPGANDTTSTQCTRVGESRTGLLRMGDPMETGCLRAGDPCATAFDQLPETKQPTAKQGD